MTDSMFPPEPSRELARNGEGLPPEDIPRFGAVDIVEAFTAMRHEWRGQTKESRALAEQIQAAVTSLQSLESKLVAGQQCEAAPEAKQLALLIVETEHQLSRALAVTAQWESNRRLREAAEAQAIEQCVADMRGAARWFARHLLALLAGQRSAREPAEGHPALEGLNMVLERLRHMMHERGLERLDVLGLPFDPDTMHAIGAMTSKDYPAGHVAEQLSPAYRWQGKLLRFADVRVADDKANDAEFRAEP
jgi:molecular chaperone GrpE